MDSLNVISLLQDLVRIPSVNPMGRLPLPDRSSGTASIFYEERMTEYLQRFFERQGWPYVIQEITPGRANIVAVVRGSQQQVLLLEAHQDTVPVDGMTIDPFEPKIEDGRIYGRGSCDVKGGMACMLTALSRIARLDVQPRPTIVMACTVDEEFAAARGVDRLSQLWEGCQGFLSRCPDLAIVAEPTMLDVVVAHKGSLRWRCHARGRAAHSSQPSLGDNAIYRMARLIQSLEVYARQVVPGLSHHPRLGSPTLSVGTIHGGLSVNTVPDRCTIEVDRRILPGEDHQQAFSHATNFLQSHLEPGDWESIEFDPPFLTSAALDDSINLMWGNRVSEIAKECGGGGKIIGVHYGTDAPPLAQLGIPTIVFGPGSIAQAHTADEWIAVDQLELATRVFERLIANPILRAGDSD